MYDLTVSQWHCCRFVLWDVKLCHWARGTAVQHIRNHMPNNTTSHYSRF